MAVIFGQKGPDPEHERFQLEWHDWSLSENIEGLRSALAEGQDIDEIVTHKHTSATIAGKHDLLRLFEFLREQGADLGKLDGHNRSPLMWAALSGSKRVAQKMLSRADAATRLSQADPEGKQPLHYAAMGGQTTLVEILLSKGADANAQDHEGRTPLHFSMIGGAPSTVKALLAGGANPSLTDKEGRPPEKMPRALSTCKNALSGGADHGMGGFFSSSSMSSMGMGSMGGHGSSSASASAASSSSGSAAYSMGSATLSLSTAQMAAMSEEEATAALWEAVSEDEDEQMAALLVEHASPDLARAYPDYLGGTSLHLAATFCDAKTIQAFAAKGAPIDALDSQSRSPLFWALEAGNEDAAEALLDAGADPRGVDSDGESCQSKAIEAGLDDLAERIEALAAKPAKPRV